MNYPCYNRSSIMLFMALLFCAITPILNSQEVIHSDIERFWKAYDLIRVSDDSLDQLQIIENEYLSKGTDGLKALVEKKGWDAASFVNAIRSYPSFWESVRSNTSRADKFAKEIYLDILKLKVLYPKLRPAQVFFTIGALGTNGTVHDRHVLIGSELALADTATITKDIQPDWLRKNLEVFFQSNPIDDIVLLNVHEFVHSQQGDYGNDLLSMSVYEGVAEFVSVIAAGKPSVTPAIYFGKQNDAQVRDRFQKEMFSPNWNDWLYNNMENEFGIRDLGYFIGYAICERYYQKSTDKKSAIAHLIELDCSDGNVVRRFVEESGYLSSSIEALEQDYIYNQPKVIHVTELLNKSKVKAREVNTISINFSKKMNNRFSNFRFGPLGREQVLPVTSFDWSEDRMRVILGVDLEANKHYQIEVSNEFRDTEGRAIENYLIDVITEE